MTSHSGPQGECFPEGACIIAQRLSQACVFLATAIKKKSASTSAAKRVICSSAGDVIMSSNELDEALRENLRLRQELAVNLVKAEAATQRDGRAAYRRGWVIHWTCLALALVAALVSVA